MTEYIQRVRVAILAYINTISRHRDRSFLQNHSSCYLLKVVILPNIYAFVSDYVMLKIDNKSYADEVYEKYKTAERDWRYHVDCASSSSSTC